MDQTEGGGGRMGTREEIRHIVCHEKKFVYAHISKTGSTAIKLEIGLQTGVIRDYPSPDKVMTIHKAPFTWRTPEEVEKLEGYTVFAFVRDPLDRLVSVYRDKILEKPLSYASYEEGVYFGLLRYGTFKAGMTFEAFAEAIVDIPHEDADLHFYPQSDFLRGVAPDFVGRFSALQRDWEMAAVMAGLTPTSLMKVNATVREPAKWYYTSHLREKVASYYRKDFDRFGNRW
jgi:hypothetical protein